MGVNRFFVIHSVNVHLSNISFLGILTLYNSATVMKALLLPGHAKLLHDNEM